MYGEFFFAFTYNVVEQKFFWIEDQGEISISRAIFFIICWVCQSMVSIQELLHYYKCVQVICNRFVCYQVTCEYIFAGGATVPQRVHTIVVSVQHSEKVSCHISSICFMDLPNAFKPMSMHSSDQLLSTSMQKKNLIKKELIWNLRKQA